MSRFDKVFSFRLLGGSIVVGLLVAALLSAATGVRPGDSAPWLIGGVWLLGVFAPGVLYCPYCRRRTRAGATCCGHCGRWIA